MHNTYSVVLRYILLVKSFKTIHHTFNQYVVLYFSGDNRTVNLYKRTQSVHLPYTDSKGPPAIRLLKKHVCMAEMLGEQRCVYSGKVH